MPSDFAPELIPRHRVGGYSAYRPTRDLAHAVEDFWTYLAPADFPRPEGPMHRVLPDPSVSIAYCCRRAPDGTPGDPRVLLVGEKTQPMVFSYDRGRQTAAVRIKIEWVEHLLELRPGEHQNTSVDLGLVLPLFAEELLENLSRTRSPADTLDTLRAALLGRQQSRAEVRHAVVTHALDAVRVTRGRCPIEKIAERAGFSARHLRRLVNDSAGVSLKSFARTTRFVTAVTRADGVEHPQWAQIAADAGFYDQSHFVRDCQEICGMTPTELDRERRAQIIGSELIGASAA